MRGGAMRTTISPAIALKASAPAKTNPIARFRIMFTTLPVLAVHVRGRLHPRDTPDGACTGTGIICIQVHYFCLPLYDTTIPRRLI
jgi:hypothetical protein